MISEKAKRRIDYALREACSHGWRTAKATNPEIVDKSCLDSSSYSLESMIDEYEAEIKKLNNYFIFD